MTEREKFEDWVRSPPFEKSVLRFSDNSSWGGQYKDYAVQLAWEAWKESRLR